MTAICRLLVCLLAAGLAGMAQSSPVAEGTQSEIRELRQQLLQISQRLAELERRQASQVTQSATPGQAVPVEAAPSTGIATTDVAQTADDAMKSQWQVPFDLSGYLSSGYIQTGLKGEAASYQAHTASLFLGKTLGNWTFHSEMEFDYRPELLRGLRPIMPYTGEVELETAWLNYKRADWLNVRAGLLMLPTYWRLHNYPSTTMTVQAPFLYENIFPPNVAGIMVHGSKYFEEGGFSYNLYAGDGREFLDSHHESRNAVGATLIGHIPTGHLFEAFDVGLHHYRDETTIGNRRIWGLESHLELGRLSWLAEFAHSRTGAGESRDLVQGYYLQPSLRLAGSLYGIYRYDQITQENERSRGERHTAGLLFRPMPQVALKFEYNRFPAQGSLAGRNGIAAGVSIFVQ